MTVLAVGCSDRDSVQVKPREPERPRRVVEPPSRGVRALPPFAIRAEGVGPYKLGASAAELLDELPSGPRIRQFTIPGVVHRDMMRGEEDAILIGAEPQGKSTFISVIRGEIARTEAGVQVGSTREEVEHSLGAAIEETDRARDPRIVIPSKLDNAHIVFNGDRVEAIVLTPVVERTKDVVAGEHTCTRPAGEREKRTFGACLSTAGELVRVGDEELSVLGKDGEKAVANVRVPGLVFAAALRNPIDGRDDIIAITRSTDPQTQTRTWTLIAYRLAEGKLLRVIEPAPVYTVTDANARWIGADLDNVDLLIELASRADAIEVGGLLTTRFGDKIRDIVVISPVPVARRRGSKPAADVVDAGLSDGGAQGSGSAERPAR